MGNTQSNTQVKPFGSINPKDGSKGRPGYYINKNNVIYQGIPITLLPDETDFQKLNFGYLKSSHRVFYNGKEIPGANPKSFHILSRKDSPKQFSKLNAVLGKDIQENTIRIYHFGNVIYKE